MIFFEPFLLVNLDLARVRHEVVGKNWTQDGGGYKL